MTATANPTWSHLLTLRSFILDYTQTDPSKETEHATHDGRKNLSCPHLIPQPRREHTEDGGADDGR